MDKSLIDRKVPPEISEAVRIARVTRRLSQEEVAKLAGTSRRVVAGFESGRDIRVSNLVKVARVVGLAVSITSEAA